MGKTYWPIDMITEITEEISTVLLKEETSTILNKQCC